MNPYPALSIISLILRFKMDPMKHFLAVGLIFSWLCQVDFCFGQFYEEMDDVPDRISQKDDIYPNPSNRFYEKPQEIEYYKAEAAHEHPIENFQDDDIQDPPTDDDPPVPIGDFWVIFLFTSAIALGIFYQLKRQNKLGASRQII